MCTVHVLVQVSDEDGSLNVQEFCTHSHQNFPAIIKVKSFQKQRQPLPCNLPVCLYEQVQYFTHEQNILHERQLYNVWTT